MIFIFDSRFLLHDSNKKLNMLKKIIKFILAVLILAMIMSGVFYFYINSQIAKPLNSFGAYEDFKINSGESINKISENLVLAGLISNSFYFKFYLWEKGAGSYVKAGEYRLSSAMSAAQIAAILIEGKIIENEITVLIPEGLTSGKVEKILVDSNLLKKGEFIDAIKSENIKKYYPAYDFLRDKPGDKNLEGYLFPDTYKFYKDAAPEEIVKKMLDNFGGKLTSEMREDLIRQKRGIFETLILASIIQKEVKDFSDMKTVAGIFTNRLKIRQMLQADSTINFITGKGTAQALFSDLAIDSLYNTYKYDGLPYGPISNPGLDAINAAIWPDKTSYFYFLTATDGKVIYSKTYEEHLKNRAKYGI